MGTMNTLIDGDSRQLSTMLEEILISGDPAGSSPNEPPSEPSERERRTTVSVSDENACLLDRSSESSSPVKSKRPPIRGSTTFPNGDTSSQLGSVVSVPRPLGTVPRLSPGLPRPPEHKGHDTLSEFRLVLQRQLVHSEEDEMY